MVGLGKTTIYDMMKEGSFPRPRRVRNPLTMGGDRSTSMDSLRHNARIIHFPMSGPTLDLLSQPVPDRVRTYWNMVSSRAVIDAGPTLGCTPVSLPL
ncbi:helix-turn-helix transcriptional regulator [Burkholderia cepacia]|uniref:helix-turn-helix transcriptional regulator n=1 Tax=Burkholderia cepacia TaxID=292 RepID=UPI00385718D1